MDFSEEKIIDGLDMDNEGIFTSESREELTNGKGDDDDE